MPCVFISMNGRHFPGLEERKKERKKEREVYEQFFVPCIAIAATEVSIKVTEVQFVNLFCQFIEEKFINEINSLFG